MNVEAINVEKKMRKMIPHISKNISPNHICKKELI
jgi:hypothetical protein